MKRIELFLIDHDEIRLDEFRFYPDDSAAPLVTLCGGSPIYCMSASRNTFAWSAGVKALTILLLRIATNSPGGAAISGHIGSPAATLDYALSKEPKWLIDFFGATSQGHSVARAIFGRRNSERKRPGPVEVFVNENHITPQTITVYLNGEIQSPAAFQPLLAMLEDEFSTAKGRGRSTKLELKRRQKERDRHRIELFLSNTGPLQLEEYHFYDPETAETLIARNSAFPASISTHRPILFTWTNAIRALTLLLLRAASSGVAEASLSGKSDSLAAALDYALLQEPPWLIDFFGMTSTGHAAARRYLSRTRPEKESADVVNIRLNKQALKRECIRVFLNGSEVRLGLLQELVEGLDGVPASSASTAPGHSKSLATQNIDERESSPLFVKSRTLRQYVQPDAPRLKYAMSSCYENISNLPVTFLHMSVVNEKGTLPPNFLIQSPEDPKLTWQIVHSSEQQSRILVEFSDPMLPGEERSVILSFNVPDFLSTESSIDHSLRVPCAELTIETSCSDTFRFHRYSIQAERDDELLFGSLPPARVKHDKTGQNTVLTWSMKNPPHGYRYRLLWAIEERKAESTDTRKHLQKLGAETASIGPLPQ